jgi:hypothetical protein
MVRDYRAWLQSEMQLLGNAAHHAYSLGQANMAKRAVERFDAELGDRVVLELDPEFAQTVAAELEQLAGAEALPEPLVDFLRQLRAESLTEES